MQLQNLMYHVNALKSESSSQLTIGHIACLLVSKQCVLSTVYMLWQLRRSSYLACHSQTPIATFYLTPPVNLDRPTAVEYAPLPLLLFPIDVCEMPSESALSSKYPHSVRLLRLCADPQPTCSTTQHHALSSHRQTQHFHACIYRSIM